MSKKIKGNIAEYTELSLRKITQSIELTEVLDELIDGKRGLYPLISIVRSNLKSAYNFLEKSKNMISNET